MRALLLVFTLLGANEEYGRFLTAASRLFENLEYERALEQLGNAKKLAKTADEQTEVALYEGIVLLELGRSDEAKAALQTALFLSPDAKLPVRVSPKVNAQIEAIRTQVKKELAPIIARREAEKREAERREAAEKEKEKKRREDEAARLAKQQQQPTGEPPPPRKIEEPPVVAPPPVAKLEPEPRPVEPIIIEQAPLQPGPKRRGVPVVALVFAGLGAGSGITAAIFGSQSEALVAEAKAAMWHLDSHDKLEQARPKALIANVMFAVTGALVLAALISAIVWAASD